MNHLHLLGFHVAQPNLDAMGAAMMRACPYLRVTGTSIVHGVGGASYEALIRECRGADSVGHNAWDGLRDRYHAASIGIGNHIPWKGEDGDDTDAYGIVCWSAGYGAARELLRVEGAPADVALWAFLDSIYGTMGPDGEPVADELALWSKLAREAVAGGRVVLIGTSDIDYVEHLPPGQRCLSTGHMARSIAATCGAQVAPVPYASTRPKNAPTHELEAGGLLVQLHDTAPGVGAGEHVAAVLPSGWGVEMLARGAVLLRSVTASEPPDTERPPPTQPSAPAPSEPELHPGDSGPAVVDAQLAIGATPDGAWGPLTTAALARWQAAHGLPVRAVWGAAERAVHESLPEVDVVRGVDVSRSQGAGEGNAWERWGVDFGFARCSSGADVDPTFAGNCSRMLLAHLTLEGAYHYTNGRPVAAQLEAIVAAFTGTRTTEVPADFFRGHAIALDIEPWNGNAHDPQWIAAMSSGIVEELVRRLQALGARVGIYSAAWAIDRIPGLAARLVVLGVWWWIADASHAALAAGHPVLGLPAAVPLEAVRFWQMGSRQATGEPAPIDDDRWLGTREELKAFATNEATRA